MSGDNDPLGERETPTYSVPAAAWWKRWYKPLIFISIIILITGIFSVKDDDMIKMIGQVRDSICERFPLKCSVNYHSRNVHISLSNETNQTISEFHASNVDSASWTGDMLGNDVVKPGQKVSLNLDDGTGYCLFDLKTVLEDGTTIVKPNFNVCDVPSYTITEAALKPAPQQQVENALRSVDVALANLIKANVAFNVPEHMRLTKTQILQAKLAVNMTPDELTAKLTGPGKKESQPLLVSNQMSATLSGGGAFDISPSGPQTQWISSTQETFWSWDVTPKQSGTQELTLAFDAHLSIDGKEGTRTVNTLTRKIEVEVAWPETPSEWLKFVKETGENLGWLWATILVPVGLFVANRIRKLRSKPAHKPTKQKSPPRVAAARRRHAVK